MLVSMTVQNIALIEQLNIQFHQGLHVLSGETGAGKSIIVDSLNLMVGERADRGLIRSGAEKASVEALFDISACPQVKVLLQAQSLEFEEELIALHREITVSGRNLCRVCGVIVPLTFLREITALLVDIHGQHEHQSLLNVKNHLGFLDSFGEDSFQNVQKKVSEAYWIWKEASGKFSALRKENAQREQRSQILESQLKELTAAHLELGEMERLSQERALFVNAEKINQAVETAYSSVFAGDGRESGATLNLKTAADAMQSIADLDKNYNALSKRLFSAYYESQELGLEIRDALSAISFDSERNDTIQERLDFLKRL